MKLLIFFKRAFGQAIVFWLFRKNVESEKKRLSSLMVDWLHDRDK